MDDDLTPEIPADKFDQHATAAQHETFDRLYRCNWIVSHLWRPTSKYTYVWVIKRDASSQGYIDHHGKFTLYKGG